MPTVDVDYAYGYENTDSPTTRADGLDHLELQRREAGVELVENIFNGFQTTSEVHRNKARILSAGFKILGVANDLALDAAEQYITVIRRRERIALARKNCRAHQKMLAMIKRRYGAGLSRKSDVMQVEGRVALAKSNLLAEESNLRDARASYVRVVGQFPGYLKPVPAPGRKLPNTKAQALRMAFLYHPVLKSANWDIIAAE